MDGSVASIPIRDKIILSESNDDTTIDTRSWDEAEVCSPSSTSQRRNTSTSNQQEGIVIRVQKETPTQPLGIFLSRATSNGPLLVTKIYEGPFSNTQLSEGMELVKINGVTCQGLSIFDAVQVCKDSPSDISVIVRMPQEEKNFTGKSQLEQLSHLAYIPPKDHGISSIANTSVWLAKLKAIFPMALLSSMQKEDTDIPDLKAQKSDVSADSTIADSAFLEEYDEEDDSSYQQQSLQKVSSFRSATSFSSFTSLGRWEVEIIRLFDNCGISLLLEECACDDGDDDRSQATRSASTRCSLREKRAKQRKQRLRRRRNAYQKSRRSSKSKKTHRRSCRRNSVDYPHGLPVDRRRMLV